MLDYQCPVCGHPELICEGNVYADFSVKFYERLYYQLDDWHILDIDYFICPKCDFIFSGNEDEFLDYLYGELEAEETED